MLVYMFRVSLLLYGDLTASMVKVASQGVAPCRRALLEVPCCRQTIIIPWFSPGATEMYLQSARTESAVPEGEIVVRVPAGADNCNG